MSLPPPPVPPAPPIARWARGLLLGAGLSSALPACGKGEPPPGDAPAGQPGPGAKGQRGTGRRGKTEEGAAAPVEVVPAAVGPITDGIEATATVEARLVAALRAGTSGNLAHFTLEEGDRVKAGQLLVRIERPGVAGNLRQARAQRAKALADARALEKLAGEGLVPGQQLEDARFTLRQAELEVERLGEEQGLERVTSPIEGVITARQARPGEAVSAGAPLFEVADLSTLEVHLRVPERHLARLRAGLPVELMAEGQGERLRGGEVTRIAPVVDPMSGTIKVTVGLGDGSAGEAPRLRPGMYVRARVVVDTRPAAVRVPKRALVREDDRVYVFRVEGEGEGGVARKVEIAVGYADRDAVEARSGLSGGDRVVVFGQRGLADGAKVRSVSADGSRAPTDHAPRQATLDGGPDGPAVGAGPIPAGEGPGSAGERPSSASADAGRGPDAARRP